MNRSLSWPTGPSRSLSSRLVPTGVAGALLVLASCGGDGGTGTDDNACQAATVTLNPGSAQLFVGNSQSFSASVLNSSGGVVSCSLTWVSAAPAVASVDVNTGIVQAVGGGQAQITARTERGVNGIVSGSAQVTVPQPDGTAQTGGTVIQDGQARVRVEVPAGGVSTPTAITIIPAVSGNLPADPPNGRVVPNSAFEFGPTGLNFASAATLAIGYNRAALPAGTSETGMEIYRVQGNSWIRINGSQVDTGAEEVRAPINGFSIYAIVAPNNQPPAVTISQPADGATVTTGQSVTFQGSATDAEDGDLSGSALAWSSSIDGPFGTGASVTTSSLSEGVHMITLTATDSEGTEGSATRTLTVEAPEHVATVRVGATASSTVQVGAQLPLPIELELTAGSPEVARVEVELSFDGVLFGADSWSVIGGDFAIVEGDSRLEGSTQVVRLVFERTANFGSSAVLGTLSLDASATGTGTVDAQILSAAEPDGTPIPTGLIATAAHQVTIQPANPSVQTLAPGTGVGNLSGGVTYFRVPVPASAASAVAAVGGPVVRATGGEPHARFGQPVEGRTGPFANSAFQIDPATGASHVPMLTRLLSDGLTDRPDAASAMAQGQTLRIQISGGTGDADLYVRFGQLPTPNTFDCRPFADGNEERCDAIDPAGGDWFIMVRPFGAQNAYAGVELSVFLFDAVSITTTSLPAGSVGTPYNQTLQAANGDGTYEWNLVSGNPPPGVQLGSDGTLTGTPTAAGDYTFTVEVVSAGKAAQAQFTIQVTAGGPVPFSYVYARNSTMASYSPDPADFENFGGGSIDIARTATGRYTVTFNGIGLGTLGDAFTVLVNAVADFPNDQLTTPGAACRLSNLNAGTPVQAFVECESPSTGAAMDARYRVLLLGNDVLGGTGAPGQQAAFSLHNQLGATTEYTPNGLFSWNSEGASQTVSPQGDGLFRHTTGLNVSAPFTLGVSTQDGAAGTGGDICVLQNGTNTFIDVLCLGRLGGTVNKAHFALQFSGGRPGTPWAYAFVVANTGLSETFSTSTGGSIDATQQGAGRWRIVFNGIDLTATPAIMVTPVLALGSSWTHCSHHRVSSAPLTVDVACYNTSPTFVETSFIIAVLR